MCKREPCTLSGFRLSPQARPHHLSRPGQHCGPSISPTEGHLQFGHSVGDILTLLLTIEPSPRGGPQPPPPTHTQVVGQFLSTDYSQGHLPSPQGPSLHPGTIWLAFVHFSLDQGLPSWGLPCATETQTVVSPPYHGLPGPRMSQARLWSLRLSSPLSKDTDTAIEGHGSHPALLSPTAVHT